MEVRVTSREYLELKQQKSKWTMILDSQTYFEVTLVQFGNHCMKKISKKGKKKWPSVFYIVAFAKTGNTKGEVRISSNI